jgi:hypothetical protein
MKGIHVTFQRLSFIPSHVLYVGSVLKFLVIFIPLLTVTPGFLRTVDSGWDDQRIIVRDDDARFFLHPTEAPFFLVGWEFTSEGVVDLEKDLDLRKIVVDVKPSAVDDVPNC